MADRAPPSALIRVWPIVGAILVAAAAALWLMVLAAQPATAAALLGGLVAAFYGGKEAGLPVGIAAGADPILLGAFLLFVDAGATCLVYPLLHKALIRGLERPGMVGDYLRFVRSGSTRAQRLIARRGSAGLFLFMLVPFAFNGPLVGAVIGRLMGLRARQIIPVLLAAIVTTMVAWTTIYAFGLAWAFAIEPTLPRTIAAIVVGIVLTHSVVSMVRFRRSKRQPPMPVAEPTVGTA